MTYSLGFQPSKAAHGLLRGKNPDNYNAKWKYKCRGNLKYYLGQKRQHSAWGKCGNCPGRFYRENPKDWKGITTGRQGRELGGHLRLRKSKSMKVWKHTISRDYEKSDMGGVRSSYLDNEAGRGGRAQSMKSFNVLLLIHARPGTEDISNL